MGFQPLWFFFLSLFAREVFHFLNIWQEYSKMHSWLLKNTTFRHVRHIILFSASQTFNVSSFPMEICFTNSNLKWESIISRIKKRSDEFLHLFEISNNCFIKAIFSSKVLVFEVWVVFINVKLEVVIWKSHTDNEIQVIWLGFIRINF